MSNWNKDYITNKKCDLPRIIISIDRIKDGIDGFKWTELLDHIETIEINPYRSDEEVFKHNEEMVRHTIYNPDSTKGITYYHITHYFGIPRENDLIHICGFHLLVNKVIFAYGGYSCDILIYTRELGAEEYSKLIGKA